MESNCFQYSADGTDVQCLSLLLSANEFLAPNKVIETLMQNVINYLYRTNFNQIITPQDQSWKVMKKNCF